MTVKDIKEEARKKLALNMHQAVIVYTVEFTLMITLIALIVMSCVGLSAMLPAAIVMLCYGILLTFIAVVGIGMVNFCMVDFYLASYRCKPYNIRRLGETLARSNVTKIFLLSLQRAVFSFLLLLCLIVPGVIYMIRTSMANYLLIANPKMTAKTALSASNKVMSGKTGSYFALCMSLIGWYLLCILTLGFGFIFVLPYTNLIKAVYYKRNLQGDKAVYVVPPQPITPIPDQAPQSAQAMPERQAVSAQQAQQPQADASAQAQPVIMPIDTLADEDLRDMNDAMRGFGGQAEQTDTVPEVPIMPIKNQTHVTVPIDVGSTEREVTKSIDGTNLVESERILTTVELRDSEEAQQQAIDAMYTRSTTKSPVRDYFSGDSNQSPDDFMTSEVIPDVPEARQDVPFVGATEQNVISDAEFDAFLREFDSETVIDASQPAAQPEQAPAQAVKQPADPEPAPHDRMSRVSPREHGRAVPDRKSATERTPSRRTLERNGRSDERNREIQERAERLKREREERLNRLKK